MRDDSLRKLQQAFQTHVLHGDGAMLERISTTTQPDATTRLAIYTNAYRLRLLEALRTDYPAVHTLAGDEMFERIGRAYIDAHPSTHYSIRYFGKYLSAFLEVTPSYREIPVLAEMARLEWSLSLAFDAADCPVVDEAMLADLPIEAWPEMHLRFHSSLHRHDFSWNVAELWGVIDQQLPPETPIIYPEPRSWIIWRQDLQNYFRPLEEAEAPALSTLMSGSDFGSMCELLCEYVDSERVAAVAAGYLKSWVQAGLVSEIY